MALYGKQKQLKRVGIYEEFCRKSNAVLFATDIAARGLGTVYHYFFRFVQSFFVVFLFKFISKSELNSVAVPSRKAIYRR